MKILLPILLCFLLLMLWYQQLPPAGQLPAVDNTPWAVSVDTSGGSRVFGVSLGHDKLTEAQAALGPNYEVAVIKSNETRAGLEMYYARFHAGPITGKLVVVAKASADELVDLMRRAVKTTTLQNGSRQYLFDAKVENEIGNFSIQSLSFVPTINIDRDMLITRFGEPNEIIEVSEQQQYFLYPQQGLAILLDQDGKELMQYVAPQDFETLIRPLTQAEGS